MRITSAFALLFLALCLTATATARVVYVDCNAPGPEHDGTTWDTAFLTIQSGVDAATPNGEVWVADGTYVENVVMGDGVTIYGGFLGAEEGGYEDSIDQRDFVNNTTAIDGNQSGSCVVMATDAGVDGFTITNGAAWDGGGVYCSGLGNTGVIANNTITACSAGDEGGGIYCTSSSPTIVANTISGNTSGDDGGGICCEYASDALVSGNTITGNHALFAGGLYCGHESSPVVTNNVIAGNSTDNSGGGVYCSGGSRPSLTNNTIHGNTAAYHGGGICCRGESALTVTNNAVTQNTTDHLGGGIYCDDTSLATLSHNDFWDNTPDDYCGIRPGPDDISDDPEFIDAAGGDFHLLAGSPCIDAGDNNAPDLPDYDFEGDPRVVDGNADGDAVVDIGADEYVPTLGTLVDLNAPGPEHDGLTWTTAFLLIQEGVDAAPPGGEVWVADGTYVENVVMGEGVAIYGGFLGAEEGGYETSLDQRNWVENVTTIDGNQSGSCIVMAVSACVNGFTVTNGSGTLESGYRHGGGFYCTDLGATGIIANNTIVANSASSGAGGGIYCYYSSPTLTANTVAENSAAFHGGGICCREHSSPTMTANAIKGNSAGRDGGGIYCYKHSSPTVTACAVTGNSASYEGGGMHCSDYSSPEVTNSAIADNSAGGSSDGGGIYCDSYSSPALTNNFITGNSAGRGGGGIYCRSHSSPKVAGNVIAHNTARDSLGGGICCSYSSPSVTANTIVWNLAWYGGGISCNNSSPFVTGNIVTNNTARSGGGIYCWLSSWPTLSHNDFWHNHPYDYYGVAPGEGDISADPMFASPDAGDWRLTSGSLCIDAGTNDAPGLPETDWEGDDRIINGTVDIGADEYVAYYTQAPDPQPECSGPLFGGSQAGFPAWVWFSIPLTPDCVVGPGCGDPSELFGFDCKGKLWYWDKYGKWNQVYRPPFLQWVLAVGNSYLLRLTESVANPSYDGLSPFTPWTFEFKLGRQGWTWVGMPGLTELVGDDFMASVRVQYPSDGTGALRTAGQDYDATPDNWITWGWPYWNTWLQAPETFTPYASFGTTTCYPWIGYRVWVNVGTPQSEYDPDQVTLIWPRTGG